MCLGKLLKVSPIKDTFEGLSQECCLLRLTHFSILRTGAVTSDWASVGLGTALPRDVYSTAAAALWRHTPLHPSPSEQSRLTAKCQH